MDLERGTIRPANNAPEAPIVSAPPLRLAPTHPPAFNLRMPDELKAELQRLARENGRSLNQEIVQRLRHSVRGYSR